MISIIGLLATFGLGGSIGIVDTAEASSYGHKSRDNLSGRSFQVHVEYLPGYILSDTPAFDNCYTFVDDGTWIDPEFPGNGAPPVTGKWIQHTGGWVTRYTGFAEVSDLFAPGVDLQLVQNGTVTPSWRRGKLRLRAYSTVLIGTDVFAVVKSTGHSVDSCD